MIRTVTILSTFLCCASAVFSQSDALTRILKLTPQKVTQLTPKPETNTVIIPSSFSEESLNKAASGPKGELQTVYYIYTGYRQNPSFDQKALNNKRIQQLSERIPEVLENRYVEWKIIEQTACSSPQMGKTFFHGFVLEYRPEISAIDREQEIANLEAFLKNPEAGFSMKNDPNTSDLSQQLSLANNEDHRERLSSLSRYRDTENSNEADIEGRRGSRGAEIEAKFPEGNLALYKYFKNNLPAGGPVSTNRNDLWVPFTMTVDEKGKIKDIKFKEEPKDYIKEQILNLLHEMPDWNPATRNGKPVASEVNLEIRISYSHHVRGMYYRDGKKPNFTQEEVARQTMKEAAPDDQTQERIEAVEKSAVFRSMEEVITKERVAMVMDVTTSMSLHLASMNWWVANSADSLNVVHYTFFNDGDNIEDRKKKSGKTGGIYHGHELKDLPATLMEAMRQGNGGDIIENDFEAVLAAQNHQSNADAVLLIVDNFSDVRDEQLLSQITMKTHVLVAGDVTTVRECYLNLAKATGGDLLVNGQRIHLGNVKKGGRITIATSTYSYDGKKFALL